MYLPEPNDLSKDVVLGSSRYVWAKVKSVPGWFMESIPKAFPVLWVQIWPRIA